MLQDILFAAILTLILIWFVKGVSRVIKVVFTQSIDVIYSPGDTEMVLQRCRSLFPIEVLRFKGAIFRYGMRVKVIFAGKDVIEGKFIGVNEEDILCFMTGRYVVTRKLDSVEEIRIVGT